MRAYAAVFRMKLTAGLQYRAAALAGLSTQFAWGFMELLAFRAFYRVSPEAFAMSFEQTVAYIWLQQAFLALFMTWAFDRDIFESVTSGGVVYELARPMDLYGRWFCQSAATRLSRTLLRCFPVLIVAFLLPAPFGMPLPASAGQFALFLLSVGLSLLVVTGFCMLIYVSAFFTISPVGMRMMSAVLADFLAGGILPLPFFPPALRAVAELLPFASMQDMPLRLYSGHITGAAALRGICLQVFWVLALLGLGRALMKRAMKRVVVQGG